MNRRDLPTEPDAGESTTGDLPSRLGHFEIIGRLGAGGMGLVFEGRDAVLDRRVALKLLHPSRSGSQVAPARLLREAQALAKLSHPNVVTVFEVGMAGTDPFVAMELVEGKTMLEWMRAPHGWREVLDVFIAVGHGLAAVHALGLVHRDFKPSNVLFDARGAPKLGDFGLVGAIEDAAGEPVASSTGTLTETGSVMGTPAYMAPEQRLGLAIDARADQYSFAKTLREVLQEPVPAALQPILDRAMATDPGDRYPEMAPLLDALARIRRGNRARWIAGGATVAVLGAIVIAWGFGRAQSAEEPCARPTARLATTWSDARRTALGTRLATIDPVLGKQRFGLAAAVLDRGGARWLDMHVAACRVSHEGRQSDALLDRRMACLDRALAEIDDTVKVLEQVADRAALDDAMKAVVGLPALDDCADVATLTELVPRPTNPVQRAEADALARETSALDVAVRTGGIKNTNAEDRARSSVTRARALGDPETLARSLRTLAAIQAELEAGATTLATLREAITAASAAHDDRLVAELWSKLLATLVTLKQAADAQLLVPAAEAAIARTNTSVEIDVDFLQTKSQVAAANGDVPRAQALLADATRALDAAGASKPGSSLAPLAMTVQTRAALTHAAAGEWKLMVDGLRAVIALATAVYGADHPSMMRLHFNLGVGLRRLEDSEAAVVEFREAARIGEARMLPSPALAEYIGSVGSSLMTMGNVEEAVPYLQRALAMARATLPPGDVRLAQPLGDLAAADFALDRYDEMRPLLDEQIALLDSRTTKPDDKLAVALYNRGNWAVMTHHCTRGFPDIDRAVTIYQDLAMPDDTYSALYLRSQCQLDEAQWAAARDTDARILAATDASPQMRALVMFDHGKALWNLGQRAAGIAEVRTAGGEMQKLEMDGATLALVDKWLGERNAKR